MRIHATVHFVFVNHGFLDENTAKSGTNYHQLLKLYEMDMILFFSFRSLKKTPILLHNHRMT